MLTSETIALSWTRWSPASTEKLRAWIWTASASAAPRASTWLRAASLSGLFARSLQADRNSAMTVDEAVLARLADAGLEPVEDRLPDVGVGLLAVLGAGPGVEEGVGHPGHAGDPDAAAGVLGARPHRGAGRGAGGGRLDPAPGVALGADVGDVLARGVHRDAVVPQRGQRGVEGGEGAGHD